MGILFVPFGPIPGRPTAYLEWGGYASAAAAVASMLHWRRFRVPAAAGMAAAAATGFVIAVLLVYALGASKLVRPLTFAAGLAVFAFAMRWDRSDPTRRTLRSDVAFWLHLAAAPMIVGPVFAAIGAHKGVVTPAPRWRRSGSTSCCPWSRSRSTGGR
jgi:hypothetical protein